MSDPFIGEIRMWACDYAPRNWALCDGSFLNIADNTLLFSIIGTLYGGDGRTTMRLPNLQGSAPMQWGQGPGLSYYRIGEAGGYNSIPLTASQLPPHDHVLRGVRDSGTSGSPDSSLYLGIDRGSDGENIFYLSNNSANTSLSEMTLATSGNGTPHENRQPFLTMNYCIALDGVYPQRS